MTEFVAIPLTLIGVLLCLEGFVANSARFEGLLHAPGCYWTLAMVCLVPVSVIVRVPPLALVLNLVVLALTATLWALDARRKETAR